MDYIVYTTEGFTQSPTGVDVENCQIIDFIYDDNSVKEEVIYEYLQSDDFCLKSGFNKDKLKVVSCINDETLGALYDVVRYLWNKEKKDFQEVKDEKKADHIFNKIETLAYYLDKDYNKLGLFDNP